MLIISSMATSNTLALLILMQSFKLYSMPGKLIQWQPTAILCRASDSG